jgi:hypothetical protein
MTTERTPEFVSEWWISTRQIKADAGPDSWLRRELLTVADAFEKATGRRCDVLRVRGAERLPIESERPTAALASRQGAAPQHQHGPECRVYCDKDDVAAAMTPHRCVGCGHRWDGDFAASICGDCSRELQRLRKVAPTPPSPWTRAQIEDVVQMHVVRWRDGLAPDHTWTHGDGHRLIHAITDAVLNLSLPPTPETPGGGK